MSIDKQVAILQTLVGRLAEEGLTDELILDIQGACARANRIVLQWTDDEHDMEMLETQEITEFLNPKRGAEREWLRKWWSNPNDRKPQRGGRWLRNQANR